MTPWQHTIALLSMHRPLGDRESTFLHTPTLNGLPRRTYVEGKLRITQGPLPSVKVEWTTVNWVKV